MNVTVLRLGHRKERDKRITTHCALVARAFGAKAIILSGEMDDSVVESVKGVVKNWGGKFSITYKKDWKKTLEKFKGFKIHCTMYGEKPEKKISLARKKAEVMVVIGAEKVLSDVYKMVDANIAVGSQPHSEVAALAIILLKLLGEKGLWAERAGAKIRIFPSEKRKNIVKRGKKNI